MGNYRTYFLGDDAIAIEPEDRGVRHPLTQALRAEGEWIDVVPGKQIVAVRFDPGTVLPSEAVQQVQAWLAGFSPEAQSAGAIVDLHIDTSAPCAPDLEALAGSNDLSTDAFLERVCTSDLQVDMLGFLPGFAYVEGVDPSLRAERLASPRQRLAAGSVGILNGQLGLYSLAGPGGWPIIGKLTETLFDSARENPFLLQAGQRIRLHPIGR